MMYTQNMEVCCTPEIVHGASGRRRTRGLRCAPCGFAASPHVVLTLTSMGPRHGLLLSFFIACVALPDLPDLPKTYSTLNLMHGTKGWSRSPKRAVLKSPLQGQLGMVTMCVYIYINIGIYIHICINKYKYQSINTQTKKCIYIYMSNTA